MGEQELYTVEEAAAYLRVDRQTVYRWSREGKLAYHTLGTSGRRRYRRADLDALLHRREEGGDPKPPGSSTSTGEPPGRS
jgi:excisionase family DNA binding protein